MGLRYVRYEFHYNFRETSSVVISRRTKDCFGTSHLFRGPCIVLRGFRRGDQPLPAYRTYCWDHRKLNTEYLLFTEGRGGLTILQSKQKETEIKNCNISTWNQLIKVLHRRPHPLQATKFGHLVILFLIMKVWSTVIFLFLFLFSRVQFRLYFVFKGVALAKMEDGRWPW